MEKITKRTIIYTLGADQKYQDTIVYLGTEYTGYDGIRVDHKYKISDYYHEPSYKLDSVYSMQYFLKKLLTEILHRTRIWDLRKMTANDLPGLGDLNLDQEMQEILVQIIFRELLHPKNNTEEITANCNCIDEAGFTLKITLNFYSSETKKKFLILVKEVQDNLLSKNNRLYLIPYRGF